MPTLTKRAFLIYWLPVVIWLGVISAESFSPLAASDETGRLLIPMLHWLFPKMAHGQIIFLHHLIRKTGHFVGYGMLSYFLFRAWRGTHHVHAGTEQVISRGYLRSGVTVRLSDLWRANWALLALLGTVIVATGDEVHQMALKSRTGTWWDVLLDGVGGLCFQLVLYGYLKTRVRARKTATAKVGA